MMQAVFLDMQYFIYFYLSVCFLFSMIFTRLIIYDDFSSGDDYEYYGIGYGAYFLMILRTSLGDFNVSSFY
jgi:hypothetical protein